MPNRPPPLRRGDKSKAKILRLALEIINVLLQGPITARQLGPQVGISQRTAYRYIKAIGEVMGDKLRKAGNMPSRWWIE